MEKGNLRSFRNELKHGERRSELGEELQIFGAEEEKDLFPDKVLRGWIFSKSLDEKCLLDLGTGESSS